MEPLAVALIGGLTGGAIAALVGGLVTLRSQARQHEHERAVAAERREDERRLRFTDDLRTLAAGLLRGAEDHRRQVSAQLAARDEEGVPGERLPSIGATDELGKVMAEIQLVSRTPETAAAASALYQATVDLGEVGAYRGDRDLDDDGFARPAGEEQRRHLVAAAQRYDGAVAAFVNAVRRELGGDPFPAAIAQGAARTPAETADR